VCHERQLSASSPRRELLTGVSPRPARHRADGWRIGGSAPVLVHKEYKITL
jgi:hypothetical protein